MFFFSPRQPFYVPCEIYGILEKIPINFDTPSANSKRELQGSSPKRELAVSCEVGKQIAQDDMSMDKSMQKLL